MTTGVIYQLSGPGCAELLAVSLFTLRRHYTGPVAILAVDTCVDLAERIAGDEASVVELPPVDGRNRHYLLKPSLWRFTPFDRSLFLDADTAVVDAVDELFQYPLAVTQFADWVTTGRRLRRRLEAWLGRSPELDRFVRYSLEHPLPAINTGVLVFDRNHPALPYWEMVATENPDRFLVDELAMQLILPAIDAEILDASWNQSPTFFVKPNSGSSVSRLHPRIWHFHGRRHVRKPEGQRIWLPFLREAIEARFADLHEWAGQYDPRLLPLL